ncbi:MAG: carbamoyltransferase [Chloroflexi bacterium]|nr:carbamoyltransferase [Chloroflexota bacterium]
MIILGITDGDDSGAVLFKDGKILAAVNEERLTRMKLVVGFPYRAIEEVIRISGIGREEIDHVAVGALVEKFNPRPLPNNGWFSSKDKASKRYQMAMASSFASVLGRSSKSRNAYRKLKSFLSRERQSGVRRIISEELGIGASVKFYPHHLCHALSSYGGSGFDDALLITLDGGGDGSCSNVIKVIDGEIELLNDLDSYHSIGNYYAYVTHISGFKAAIHEGKITGLAAYGKPVYADMFKKLIGYKDGQITNIGNVYYHSAIRKIRCMLPPDYKMEDLAASIQEVLEEVCVDYCEYWVNKAGIKNVGLAGGVFSNVKLNQRIAEIPGVEQVYVFPHMGDGGLAAGAVFAAAMTFAPEDYRHGFPGMEDAYLGPQYADTEIESALIKESLEYEKHEYVEGEIARLLADGHVVARFDGRMEYGPRALGNRSILFQTTDPAVNDWLNQRLNRTEFMPFAPLVLHEDADDCFIGINGSAHAAEFMTITFDCTEWMESNCPAVVHVDGTARPQLMDEDTNPSMYRIITEYKQMTGLPCVVNTSFNMHEEPIVCTPEDAIRAFRLGHLDYLAIGSYIAKSPEPVDREIVPSTGAGSDGLARS